MRAFYFAVTFISLITFNAFDANARGRGHCGGFYGPPMYYSPAMYYGPAPAYAAAPGYKMPPMTAQPPAAYGRPAYQASPSDVPSSYARPPASPAPATTTVKVGAYDNRFEPQTITVAPGSTVQWTNAGNNTHTVTAYDRSWDSGDLAPGATYSATFQRPGTYQYYCRHHQQDRMAGTIVVPQGGSPAVGQPSTRRPGY